MKLTDVVYISDLLVRGILMDKRERRRKIRTPSALPFLALG